MIQLICKGKSYAAITIAHELVNRSPHLLVSIGDMGALLTCQAAPLPVAFLQPSVRLALADRLGSVSLCLLCIFTGLQSVRIAITLTALRLSQTEPEPEPELQCRL